MTRKGDADKNTADATARGGWIETDGQGRTLIDGCYDEDEQPGAAGTTTASVRAFLGAAKRK